MDKYTTYAYGSAGLTAFFASLSLYEWGFIIGMAFSMILGVITFIMTRREQRRRTAILQSVADRFNPDNPSATVVTLMAMAAKAPKDI